MIRETKTALCPIVTWDWADPGTCIQGKKRSDAPSCRLAVSETPLDGQESSSLHRLMGVHRLWPALAPKAKNL